MNNILTQSYKYAKNSMKNVISHIRTYLFVCLFFGFTILPADPQNLCIFMELMSLTSSYGHLKNISSSIKYLHAAYGSVFPSSNFSLDTTMQGLKRRLARTPFFVMPITPEILIKIYSHLNMSRPEDLALWCSFLVAFFCLFRKSNVVPETLEFDPKKTLTRDHIAIDKAARIVYINVTFSKTIQFCSRDLVIPIPENEHPALDLVRHMEKLLDTVKADPKSPAFSYSLRSFVTYKSFTARLKSLLTRAGLNPNLYSGHSFRRGGATFLHQVGGSILQIQAAGDWSSQCFTRYLYLSTQERLQAHFLLSNAISSLQL